MYNNYVIILPELSHNGTRIMFYYFENKVLISRGKNTILFRHYYDYKVVISGGKKL